MKIEFSSQRREMLSFLTANMAAVTSRTNQQYRSSKNDLENLSPRAYFRNSFYDRLQNSPYFCVFKYARAVEQKVGNEAENRERDWGHTPYGRVRLARFACARLLRLTLPISLLILRKKKKKRLFCSLLLRGRTGRVCRRCPLQDIGRLYCRKMPLVNTGRKCNADEFQI